jgi:type IX secretion system PorP/SprF family membrane protein
MKKFIISLSVIGFMMLSIISTINGQSRYFDERYIYSQHNINPSLINPGAIGANDYQELFVNYRNTWSGFEDSPKTVLIAYNGPVGNRLGFGAQLLSDSYANLNTTKGQIGLSYTIDSPTNKIGFGISTEYIQHSLSGAGVSGVQVDITDPIIRDRLDGAQYFDASFGIFGLYNQKLVYGISFPSLISSKISDTGSEADRNIGYIFQVGYKMKSPSTDITFEPSVVVKSLMNTPTHIDVMGRFGFLDDKLTGGIAYTIGGDKRLGFLIGTTIEALTLNYMYNVSSAEFQTYNNGAHEISIGLRFGDNKMAKQIDQIK